MKKFKKLLAGLLTGAMLLGSMSVSAFAAEHHQNTSNRHNSKTGSITIHKYEYNGNRRKGQEQVEDILMRQQCPSMMLEPLEGAGFTIYKVADVN